MKRLNTAAFLIFISSLVCAQTVSDGQKKFIKGNILEKTAAVKDAAGDDALALSSKGIDFVLENRELLGADRDLSALAVASVLTLPKDKEVLSENFPELDEKLVQIFNLFNDETVRIAVLNELETLALTGNEKDRQTSVQLMNSYLTSVTSSQASSPVVEKAVNSLGKTGDGTSFAIMYSAWKNNSFPVFQNQTEAALIALSQSHVNDALAVVSNTKTAETAAYFNLIQKNSEISKEFKAEIAENALSMTINNTEDLSGNIEDSIKLQLDCLTVIANAHWTRASSLAVRYFSLAKEEYAQDKMTEVQFIRVINSLTELSSTEAAKALSGYLAEMNKNAEKGTISAQNVVLAVIKSLGVLGDKSAFDNLLYVTYLNYPEEVKGSARDALAKLKW